MQGARHFFVTSTSIYFRVLPYVMLGMYWGQTEEVSDSVSQIPSFVLSSMLFVHMPKGIDRAGVVGFADLLQT